MYFGMGVYAATGPYLYLTAILLISTTIFIPFGDIHPP